MGNDAHDSHAIALPLVPLLGETIGANLERIAGIHRDREALVDVSAGRRWTYAEFDAAIDEVARGMLGLGIQVGDRVGIWAPNCAEWVFVQYATAKIGAILVNINPTYRVHELEYAVQQSGVRLMVCAPGFRSSDYRAMLAEIGFARNIFIGEPTWDALISVGRDVDENEYRARRDAISSGDAINIQYTSGTTGSPKGATLSHDNILNNGYFVGEGVHYTEHDRVCIPVPLYHCFGMVMGNLAATSHGACIVLPAPAFDPEATLAAVEAERCTSLYGVPTMFIAELDHPRFAEFDLRSLRTGIMAGSPCPVEVMRRVIGEMHMSEVAIGYGMTETSPVSTMTRRSDDVARRTETVGRVMPNLEIRVVDAETGVVVPRGASGELCTRGYSVMLGYWNDSERTAEAIDPDGWMRTGDLATMDADGYVSIVGRIKDMVIRGGENVYPREIEEFLFGHPDISDVQVIGVPDPHWGEELMAWIVMRPGTEPLTAEAVRQFCDQHLARHKIPRYVHVVDGFPMTVTGKVRKVEMREQALDLLALTPPPAGR